MHFYVCMYAGSSDKAKVHGTNKDIGTQKSVQAGKQSNQSKNNKYHYSKPCVCACFRTETRKFSDLKRAMEQSCLEIHDLNLNRARLHKKVQISGLRFRGRMPTDGNCMFHAVQDQLERVHSTEKYSHSELRANTVAYLEAHPFLVRNYIYIYIFAYIYILH